MISLSLFYAVVFSEVSCPEPAEPLGSVDIGSGSSGAGGGVVAILHPIQASMTRTAATAKKAVICRTTIA